MSVVERSTTLDSRATNGTLSSLSRDTPINDHENTARQQRHDDKPSKLNNVVIHIILFLVRINPAPVLGNRCYEQAYVSYVDHPSAFFIQLSRPEEQYTELHKEIK
jgi:hypothetical protein